MKDTATFTATAFILRKRYEDGKQRFGGIERAHLTDDFKKMPDCGKSTSTPLPPHRRRLDRAIQGIREAGMDMTAWNDLQPCRKICRLSGCVMLRNGIE
jgi:hypothetical protein